MRKISTILLLTGFAAILPGIAAAAPCDGSSDCERPSFNPTTQGGWSISASGASGVKSLVSVGPTGNVVGSQYYFGAANSNLGATIANGGFTPGGSGARVISTAFATNASQTPSATVAGGSVQQLLGNTPYFFYAQACPNGSGIYNSARCSEWTQIGTATTAAYPTNVFSTPVKPTDTTINTINARVAVPTADVGNISLVRLDIRDLITPANNQTLADIAFVGNGIYSINNTMYTQNGGFKPNVKYEFRGRVVYPYNIGVPTAAQETETGFWTIPANPFNVTTANVTHCSVQVTARNSNGVQLPNPSYTPYRLCATGVCGTAAAIGGTGIATDTISQTITGLTPNTSYTPNARANVGNGSDATATGWNNSSTVNGTAFQTLDWGGTFGITNVGTTTADFTTSGITGAGSIATWQMIVNGVTAGQPSGAGAPPATINLTGLTPNTQYTVRIRLTETSGCFSDLPVAGVIFATDPFAPTAPASLTSVQPTQLTANWTDGSANPATSVFELEHCSTGFGTGTCVANLLQTKSGGTSRVITGLTPSTQYFVRVRTRNVSRPTWPDSAWFNIASATTPPDVRSITIAPASVPSIATGNNQLFTATVRDDLGAIIAGQAVNWSVNGGGNLSAANGVSTTFTATTPGVSWVLTASLAGWPDATAQITVVASGVQVVTPASIVLNSDGVTGNVSVLGQDNVLGEPSIQYAWSKESGPGNVNFAPNGTNAAKNSVATFTKAGAYVLRVTLSNANGSAFSLTPSTTVVQRLVRIVVTPDNMTVKTLEGIQFVAAGVDQFGDPKGLSSVEWNATGGGSINGAGAFTATTIGQNYQVRALSEGQLGVANLSVVNYDVSAAKAYPVPFKGNRDQTICFEGVGTSAKLRIFTASGLKVFERDVADVSGTGPSGCDFPWDVKNSAGERVASGVYFYLIESQDAKKEGKIVIIQ